LPLGFTVIGSAAASLNNKERLLLFLAEDATKTGELGWYYPQSNSYAQIIRNPCFNFHSNHQINALVKIKADQTAVTYFTDKVNPYRSINLSNLSDYLDGSNQLICDRILFAPTADMPIFKATQIIEGGNAKLGQYRFYLRYIKKDQSKTNVISHTQSVQITRGNDFNTVEGGYNIGDSNIAIEAYPKTTKSIRLELSNLDADFESYEILIAEYTSGTGQLSRVSKSNPISITQDSWVFTGSNTIVDTSDAIIIDGYMAKFVEAHTVKDNRLWIGNLSDSSDLDYATIQRAALDIKVRWKAKRMPKFAIPTDETQGAGLVPLSRKTFMRDEVYALGIIGTKLDGSKTPVFHIPGRAPVTTATGKIDQTEVFITRNNYSGNWDTQLLGTLGTDVFPHEVEHLSQYIVANQIPRWRVYNTSWTDTDTATEFAGELAYYENDVNYPDINTPQGKLYGALTNQKIRHHKMPDTNTVPHVSNTEVRPLELDVDISLFVAALPTNITSEIQSWEIVVGQRAEENKTVLDKGITTFNDCNRQFLKPPTVNHNYELVNFYSPKTLFGQKQLNGSHYKTEWYNSYWDLRNDSYEKHFQIGPLGSATEGRVAMTFTDWVGKTSTDISANANFKSNYKIKAYQYIQSATVKNGEESWTQGVFDNVIATEEEKRNYSYDTTVCKLQFTNNFLVQPVAGSGSNTPRRGFVTYGSVKSEHSVYDNLHEIAYFIPLQKNVSSIVNISEGDSFITPVSYVTSELVKESSTLKHIWHEIHHFWAETDENVGLRHSSNIYNKLDNQIYYKGWSHSDGTFRIDYPNDTFSSYLTESIGTDTSAYLSTVAEGNSFKQAYLYNTDYSNIYPLKAYYQNPLNYDYDSTTQNKEYYRWRYSEKDFDDVTTDAYRDFRINNTGTIPAINGEIKDMFVDKNKLFIRTNRSLLYLPTNTQVMKTSDGSVYLGTGEVAPHPAQAITTLDWSHAGGYDFTHRLVTEFGTVLYDIFSRKVFILRDSLEDITPKLSAFFKTHGKWDMLDKGVDFFPNKLQLTYDSYLKRFLIKMKHYKFKADNYNQLLFSELSWNEETNLIDIRDTITGALSFSSPDFILEEEVWTLSYSFLNNSWTSWHSYNHNWSTATERGFVGFSKDKLSPTREFAWRHYVDDDQDSPYGKFNSKLFPMKIEWTVNDPNDKQKYLEHIKIDSRNGKWDEVFAYSQNQHTGVNAIQSDVEGSNTMLSRINNGINLSQKEGYFRVDNFTDKTTDISASNFLSSNRLDKQVDISNLTAAPQMYQKFVKGKWIRVGLNYMPTLVKTDNQTIWSVESAIKVVDR
jgi:hypothetical protein